MKFGIFNYFLADASRAVQLNPLEEVSSALNIGCLKASFYGRRITHLGAGFV